MGFSKDFVWGAATAAYQIEGAYMEDGRGPSIWDTYAHDKRFDEKNGKCNVLNGETGDIACDHYHRYKEDVQNMKKIGLKAYRFSISWSRIFPNGKGEINKKGLDFYSNLVDELLLNDIEPYITLFHWDLPQAMQDIGGWLNPSMPEIFAGYVKTVVLRLSDRVSNWMTLNEAQCHIIIGHIDGDCAPKLRVTEKQGFYLIHNILKAHGRAVQTIRNIAIKKPNIGIAPNPTSVYPASEKNEDIAAARKAAFAIKEKNFWCTKWWLDPIFFGKYPQDGIEIFGKDFPLEIMNEEDMKIISQPIDFIGCNFYQGSCIKSDENGNPIEVKKKVGFDQTAFKWQVTPEILHYMPNFLYERYKCPIFITENGLSMADWVSLDGKVHDPQRIDFLHRYLTELDKSIKDGTPVKGYFTWSIMDNFEWSNGYSERFGLIHIDFDTQKRTLKDSAYWYKKVIENNELNFL